MATVFWGKVRADTDNVLVLFHLILFAAGYGVLLSFKNNLLYQVYLLVKRGVLGYFLVDLFHRMYRGGMVPPQFFPNIRIGNIQDLPHKKHGHLPRLHHLFASAFFDQVADGDVEELRDGLQDVVVAHFAREAPDRFFYYFLRYFFGYFGLFDVLIEDYLVDHPHQFPDVLFDLTGHQLYDLVPQVGVRLLELVLDNGHAHFIFRIPNVRDKTAFEPRAQPLFECGNGLRRVVG